MMRVHVVGGGLAGLAAAVSLVAEGRAVTLSEASPQAGGRCRSYHDRQLGLTIDNGNHLLLSGNHAAMRYLATIGASDRLTGPARARLDFFDRASGERWAVAPNRGRVPWWLFSRARRVPGTSVADYLALARLVAARRDAMVAETIPTDGALWRRLIEPFLVAVLNTPARGGSAALAGAVIAETLAKGAAACRPLVATPTLSAAFVDPALDWLRERGADVRLGRRLRGLEVADGRVAALDFADGREALGPEDGVVLAVPAWVATTLLPGLAVPTKHHAIVNAHFRIAAPAGAPPIVGVIGGTAEWVFAFPDRLSVTISAADRHLDTDRETLAQAIWADVAAVHGLDGEMPAWQLVREKRATFSATPAQDALRPEPTAPGFANLALAGDWTRTGLPATIEAAIRSGNRAARIVAGGDGRAA
ncbi:hydroxysqualene dehydroxylase HpnE [Sphingomonas sp.]|uniref:hydroxysqualene dehydroxylase HpnE n=1 Tax=Sphingomonas sp. TaxID=28214 RepID=UPI003B006367